MPYEYIPRDGQQYLQSHKNVRINLRLRSNQIDIESMNTSNRPLPPLISSLRKIPDLCIYDKIQKTRILTNRGSFRKPQKDIKEACPWSD